jgi:hypothetical protein
MAGIDYALAQRLCRKHKGALTRARKKGPRAVVAAVNAFYAEFREHDLPLPDAWHTWETARLDALMEVMREDWD